MTAEFLVAQADDQRWRQFADVIIHRDVTTEPLLVAATTLAQLPGCSMVAVPCRPNGFLLAVRGRPPVLVTGRDDIDECAVAVYSTLLSLDRNAVAWGSLTWS